MNKNSLNAAVKRLADFKGKEEAEVKAAIKADPKGFTDEEADEVYAAFTADGSEFQASNVGSDTDKLSDPVIEVKGTDEEAKKHIVISCFRDKDNWDKEYNPGDDVSHFDADRLQDVVEKGLVEKQ